MSLIEGNYLSVIPIPSVVLIAENIGVTNLSSESVSEITKDVTFRVRSILQDAIKFMHHCNRAKLLPVDIDNGLKVNSMEPLYGFIPEGDIPFGNAFCGNKELSILEDKEVDLKELMKNDFKLPFDISLRSHWMAIDGVQPTIPENPPPSHKNIQKSESIDPTQKLRKTAKNMKEATRRTTFVRMKKHKLVDTSHVKELATHELSIEQQLYYKEITEACVGSDEMRRTDALQSLASDPGIHDMLPRMCTFVSEGIKINIVQNNLALLIYLTRMARSLLDNPTLHLERYLHELIPAILSCILSKQLCSRPEQENHWALRDFASRIIAHICKSFNSTTNGIQTRITRIYCNSITKNSSLTSLYGGIQGLAELGQQVVRTLVYPRIILIGARIELVESQDSCNLDKIAANSIKMLVLKTLTQIVKTIEKDNKLEHYREKYGYFANPFYEAIHNK